MWRLSWWALPLFSSVIWLAMLLALFISWFADGRPHYASMDEKQKIAYISDVGADHLKPLFIAMGTIAVVTLDVSFIAERWLRHKGRLHKNTSAAQKWLSVLSIIAAIGGAAGLILLSIFDVLHHKRMHDAFLTLFIAGYVLSAIFICAEYQRLGMHFREHSILRISFWIKLTFILVEVALAIVFGVGQRTGRYNMAAITEWVIALIFTFYLFSFFMDFIPASRSRGLEPDNTQIDQAMDEAEVDGQLNGRHRPAVMDKGHVNGHANGYTNGYTNGHTNGHINGHTNGYVNGYGNTAPRLPQIPPSSNF